MLPLSLLPSPGRVPHIRRKKIPCNGTNDARSLGLVAMWWEKMPKRWLDSDPLWVWTEVGEPGAKFPKMVRAHNLNQMIVCGRYQNQEMEISLHLCQFCPGQSWVMNIHCREYGKVSRSHWNESGHQRNVDDTGKIEMLL